MLVNTSPFRETSLNEIKRVANNEGKIKLSGSEISLQFIRGKDIGSTYKVEFWVNISPKDRMENPSDSINLRDLDNRSLKKAIMKNIPRGDDRYMELNDFDDTKAVFHLKTDKWLEDATNNLKSNKKMASFKMLFSLKEEPPKMILQDTLRNEWSDFVVRKIKQWMMEKKRRESHFLKDLFPKGVQRKIRQTLTNMFDWEYDVRWNRVEAQLQNKWIIALLYATSELTKKESLDKLKSSSDKYKFPTKVKKNVKRKEFDTKKWKKFINKRYF